MLLKPGAVAQEERVIADYLTARAQSLGSITVLTAAALSVFGATNTSTVSMIAAISWISFIRRRSACRYSTAGTAPLRTQILWAGD
jgi:hypothetical protein